MSDFIAIGGEELVNMPPLKSGEAILCPHCGESHIVKGGTDTETGEETDLILAYTCGDKTYIAGIDGTNIMSRFMKGNK